MIRCKGTLVSAVAVIAAAIACLAPPASADHMLQDLVSPGGSAPYSWDALHMSPDTNRVLFSTPEPLDPADTDTYRDVYERVGETFTRVAQGGAGDLSCCNRLRFSLDGSHVFFRPLSASIQLVPEDRDITVDVYEAHGGVTRLASVGDLPSNGLFDATLRDASDDGSRVYFTTDETLVAEDTDGGYTDIYERSSAGTRLVSAGGNGEFDAAFQLASDVGATVVFSTREQLVAADTDGSTDLYANSPSATELVSTGPVSSTPGTPQAHALSTTGDRVVFSTTERLVPEDADGTGQDIYVRAGGTTQLVSTGPTATNAATGAIFDDASADGTAVLFHTREHLTAGHTWSDFGFYRRSGSTTDLVVPVPLVVGFEEPGVSIGLSGDGSHAFYTTSTQVLPDDTDFNYDIYQWQAGVTTRVSTGLLDVDQYDASLGGTSFDGDRVFFNTWARHVPEDASLDDDVYERFDGQTALLTKHQGGYFDVSRVSHDGTAVLVETQESLDHADTDAGWSDAYLYTAPSPASSFWNVTRADDFTRPGP